MPFGLNAAGMRLHPLWEQRRRENNFPPLASPHGASTNTSARVWKMVYADRIAHLSYGNASRSTASFFPGLSPALRGVVSPLNFAFERFEALRLNQFAIGSTPSTIEVPNPPACWAWKVIEKSDAAPVTNAPSKLLPVDNSLAIFASKARSIEALRGTFVKIHRCWSNTDAPDYPEEALRIALAALCTQPAALRASTQSALAVILELEEYASYCALLSKFEPVWKMQRARTWIEVSFTEPAKIRASEKCFPEKILVELQKLSSGSTVPLLVNEFGCVADGNHRLTASWIWNALHFAPNENWAPGDASFEHKLLSYFEKYSDDANALVKSNALDALAALLFSEHSRKQLNQLRGPIASYVVATLPVVPILSYNGFALDRLAMQVSGYPSRFNPLNYQDLRDDPFTTFPVKACYHLADHLPLPAFNVLSKDADIERRKI
ncbi:MAG TPA: hypothetical protein V6C76_10175 [Drouetiella sp.]